MEKQQKKENFKFILECISLVVGTALKLVLLNIIMSALCMTIYSLPSNLNADGLKKGANERATTTELTGATQLSDFNTWTYNNLGGATVYSPYCIRIYSDGGSSWSYLWTTITFKANSYVNYNFHVKAENSDLRTGIRIYNPSTGTDYVNKTTTLSGSKTYQGTLKITTAETIRFDLRRNWYGTGYKGGCVWSMSMTYSDYNDGYNAGYNSGLNDGYEQGFEEGQDDVKWNPNNYDLYTQEQYNQNYENGKNAGYDLGYLDGHADGEEFGYNEGYTEGKDEGYDLGYDAGWDSGVDDGYDAGYQTGKNQGYLEGKDEGYTEGYQTGHDEGYTEGHDEGYQDGQDDLSGLGWFKYAMQVAQSFFDLELIPNISLGAIFGGLLILFLVVWILSWFK